ncbi:MAG TPA: AAA family ATPase [Kofleriaceae bacterium]|nr:AAA family ATPase [Kofleriaceae bacterium]
MSERARTALDPPSAPRYVLGELLHEDSHASTYRALRCADERAILLKVLAPDHVRARDLARLVHDHEIGRALAGTAVVAPLELTTFEGRPALELEAFPGEPLERRVGAPLPLDELLPIALQLAAVVAVVHERGVVHKDVKPANVWHDRDTGQIALCSFELATRSAGAPTTPAPVRALEGSLPYMSPEQTGRMNRVVDSRSDLYSLGVTLYQLATGRLPYEAHDAMAWVHCHVAVTPPRADEVNPELPRAFADLVGKLLEKVPDDRYQSASGLRRDLERCLRAWQEHGRVAAIALGEHDVSDRFLIPHRLFGRDAESLVLREAFARMAETGAPELILLSGGVGAGKSALVRQLLRPIARRRGLYVAAKFEQLERRIPYLTFARAFGELARDLLVESAEQIAAWRRRLAAAIGPHGALVTELVPDLGLILGPQPVPPELPPHEAEGRARQVLRRLIGAFAAADHPLTIFLDDLQWSDAASLALLDELLTSEDTRYVLVIGAYRDAEVGADHPLARAIARMSEPPSEKIPARDTKIQTIALAPLSADQLVQLVASTLHATEAEAAPLARLVHEKTAGNPFFAIQLLSALHREGAIWFERRAERWCWDAERIRAAAHTDNVIELMRDRLGALPAETRHALEIAACIGATADRSVLEAVLRRDPDPLLQAAVDQDLLLQLDHGYRFPHDRVHEAAYSLVPEADRPRVHLEIGRQLAAQTQPAELPAAVFEIVNQLERGAALLPSREDRAWLARLELAAGTRAREATAYASALKYFTAGATRLADGGADPSDELWFQLSFRQAECAFLTGDTATAERVIAELHRQPGRSRAERAAIYRLEIDLLVMRTQPAAAIAAGLACLRLFDVHLSAHPDRGQIEAEYEAIWRNLNGRTIEELAAQPLVADPDVIAELDVLAAIHVPAFTTGDPLFLLVLCRIINLSLQHGAAGAVAHAYAYFGTLLGPVFHRYAEGTRFARVALALVEQHGFAAYLAKVHLALSVTSVWTEPPSQSAVHLRASEGAARDTGDQLFACYASGAQLTDLLLRGADLDIVWRESERALALARRTGFRSLEDAVITQQRLVAGLQGRARASRAASDAELDDAAFERRLTEGGTLIDRALYWVLKLEAYVLSGDHRAALDAAEQASRMQELLTGLPLSILHHYFRALALAASYEAASPEEQRAWRAQLAGHQAQLAEWAAVNPPMFRDKHALVAAEIARLDGEVLAAELAYEEAIAAAHEQGFSHGEALACELASRFYRGRRLLRVAELTLREAHASYRRWGAHAKVGQLELLNPQLAAGPQSQPAAVALRAEQLDLVAAFKASQIISGVMDSHELWHTLLRLVLEGSGARRAVLAVPRGEELEIAAETAADDRAAQRSSAGVPRSVLRYALRTQQPVALDAGADLGRFAHDAWFAGARPRSILCVPIRRQGAVVALLYLENDLVSGAFPPEQLLALELLAGQAAISLENAQLLAVEHAARLEAEAAERRARLLDEATAMMSRSLDRQGVVDALNLMSARLIADWSMIDLDEGGALVRIASAHRDPALDPILRELVARYPPGINPVSPTRHVMQTGERLVMPELTPEQVRASSTDDRHYELGQQLGMRSAVVVPLAARDRRLGALTVFSGTPRWFGPADVELVSELGRRIALWVDNARLLDETRRALQLRGEFLSIASHELRTPLAALRLTAQGLLRAAETGRAVPPEFLDRSLHRMLSRTARLEELTSELIDVTRIEQGRLELVPSELALDALVRDVALHLEPELAAARCTVAIDCPAPVTGVWDGARLEQVITNLLGNALKFAPGQPIELRIVREGDRAILTVTDHGIGIDPARRPYIFDRFERAVSPTNYGGLGLGLYIARSIVVAHGGTIEVASEPGHGATFTVTLPCAR